MYFVFLSCINNQIRNARLEIQARDRPSITAFGLVDNCFDFQGCVHWASQIRDLFPIGSDT